VAVWAFRELKAIMIKQQVRREGRSFFIKLFVANVGIFNLENYRRKYLKIVFSTMQLVEFQVCV
jgi:hypothetical protein